MSTLPSKTKDYPFDLWRVSVNGTAYTGMIKVNPDGTAGPGIRAGDGEYVYYRDAMREIERLRSAIAMVVKYGAGMGTAQWDVCRRALGNEPPGNETGVCNCPPSCQGPDNTDKRCRAEDEQPEPFCKKHPNTAFADIGCLFCGTPPSVDGDAQKAGEQR